MFIPAKNLTNLMTAGPIVTTNIAGNRQNTSGKTILTPIFCALLLGSLAALRPAHLRLRAKGLRDARPEPVRLNQHRHELTHVIDLRALGEVLERLHSGLAGANLRS